VNKRGEKRLSHAQRFIAEWVIFGDNLRAWSGDAGPPRRRW
jgi:hypothetical protein